VSFIDLGQPPSTRADLREHILLEMVSGGDHTIQNCSIPAKHPPISCPLKVERSSTRSGIQLRGFPRAGSISGQDKPPRATPIRVRNCNVIKSTPGPADRTHYAQVKTWIDPSIGFPVYVEKTVKETGAVKEFTSYGVRQERATGFAHQIEVTHAASKDRHCLSSIAAASRQNSPLPISRRPRSPTSRRLMHAALWFVTIAAVLLATGVLYQWIGDWRDRRRYAGSGRWVPIANGAQTLPL